MTSRNVKVKALALFSGGLDSTLAAKVVLDQGLHTEGLHLINTFLCSDGQEDSSPEKKESIAGQLGIKLNSLNISCAHLKMVLTPRYGYGKNMNPCIDCRILMLKEAISYMHSCGFSFLVSGEVLGQRPMSQRRAALDIIDRDACVKGLLLRPLSARLLKPTLPEEKGWVNRDRLYGFSGRSRKPQLALAQELGIKEYFSPAGGCLLTSIEFTRKFRDLVNSGQCSLEEIDLLKRGRHFRYNSSVKIVVGKNEQDNRYLTNLAKAGDILLRLRNFTGPLTVVRPTAAAVQQKEALESAAQLTARYSKGKDQQKVWVDYCFHGSEEHQAILVAPATEELVKRLRI